MTAQHTWATAAVPLLIAATLLGQVLPARAQFAYEGMRQGVGYRVYINARQSLGQGRWRFRTKAVYSNGSAPYVSGWRIADCYNATIDGVTVRAVAQYGYQEGEASVLRAVCGGR